MMSTYLRLSSEGINRIRKILPFFSLGTQKILSRTHMKIRWDEGRKSWVVECYGKNGLTLTLLDQPQKDGKYRTRTLAKGDKSVLTTSTPMRTSTEGKVRFWFQPAV
mmetsp:Transcript_23024/g.34299  ORF Transcript_23024/g.34299 Transcript_23024/m.34299 type:complete len:107 (+) Transcript_23024:39-359(+)